MQALQKFKEDAKAARARMGMGGPARFYDPEQDLKPSPPRLVPLPVPKPEPKSVAAWRKHMEIDAEKMTPRGRKLAQLAREHGHRLEPRKVDKTCRSYVSMALKRRRIFNAIASTAKHFGVHEEMILSRDRHGDVVRRRHVAIYLARKHSCGAGYVMIGQAFGLDHTTVLHAFRKVAAWVVEGEQETLDEIAAIEAIMGVEG